MYKSQKLQNVKNHKVWSFKVLADIQSSNFASPVNVQKLLQATSKETAAF